MSHHPPPESPKSLRDTLEATLGVPFESGNRVDILRNGSEIFPAMLEAIEAAKVSVDFLTFVYWGGDIAERFAEALAGASRRGVRVRVVLDGLGSLPMDRELVDRIEEAGGRVVWFRPISRWTVPWRASSRTHRKILVCDDRVGFTGGVGIGEEWEGDATDPTSWRETHFRMTGPSVRGLGAAFLENWLEAADDVGPPPAVDEVAPTGTLAVQVVRSRGGIDWSDRATLVWTLVGAARRSIRISTPYLVLNDTMAGHFLEAARRGVDVSMLVPGPHIDHRVAQVAGAAHYEALLEAGVRICEYQPTMIHQKIAVYDDEIVSVGSGNLNQRSQLQDHEVQLVVADGSFAARINDMLDEDFAQSRVLRPGDWKERGLLARAGEFLTRPFRRQL